MTKSSTVKDKNKSHRKNKAIIMATWSYEYIISIKKQLFLKELVT